MKKMFNFSLKVLFVLFVSFAAVACSNGGDSSSEDSQLSGILNSDDGTSDMDKETEKFYKKIKKLENELLKAKTCEDVKKIEAKFDKLRKDAHLDFAEEEPGFLGFMEKRDMLAIAMGFAFELTEVENKLNCD